MHEASIVAELMTQLDELINANQLRQVDKVHVQVGAMQLVVPEALQAAFVAAAAGTPCQDASLEIEELPVHARCNQCRHEFQPPLDQYTCPQCGAADNTILQGNEIILFSIEGESDSAAETLPDG